MIPSSLPQPQISASDSRLNISRLHVTEDGRKSLNTLSSWNWFGVEFHQYFYNRTLFFRIFSSTEGNKLNTLSEKLREPWENAEKKLFLYKWKSFFRRISNFECHAWDGRENNWVKGSPTREGEKTFSSHLSRLTNDRWRRNLFYFLPSASPDSLFFITIFCYHQFVLRRQNHSSWLFKRRCGIKKFLIDNCQINKWYWQKAFN